MDIFRGQNAEVFQSVGVLGSLRRNQNSIWTALMVIKNYDRCFRGLKSLGRRDLKPGLIILAFLFVVLRVKGR